MGGEGKERKQKGRGDGKEKNERRAEANGIEQGGGDGKEEWKRGRRGEKKKGWGVRGPRQSGRLKTKKMSNEEKIGSVVLEEL